MADTTTAQIVDFIKKKFQSQSQGGTKRTISDQGTGFSFHLIEENVGNALRVSITQAPTANVKSEPDD